MVDVHRIILPDPPMGSKCFFIERKGIYVLEAGEGTLRSLACTHVGAGMFMVYDGVCDERGFFPDEGKLKDPYAEPYWTANGRPLFGNTPQVMGFWAVDAGFIHGLTIKADGGIPGTPVFVSVSWLRYKSKSQNGAKPVLIQGS